MYGLVRPNPLGRCHETLPLFSLYSQCTNKDRKYICFPFGDQHVELESNQVGLQCSNCSHCMHHDAVSSVKFIKFHQMFTRAPQPEVNACKTRLGNQQHDWPTFAFPTCTLGQASCCLRKISKGGLTLCQLTLHYSAAIGRSVPFYSNPRTVLPSNLTSF